MVKEYDLSAPRKELLEAARRDFGKVTFEPVTLGDHTLKLLQIADMPAYLEKLVGKTRPGSHVELPLWAKLWPAASILTMFAMRFPIKADARILEVGAGLGLTGLALAAKGHAVTVSDIDPGSLLFMQINALENGLDDRVTVRRVDITTDTLDEQYDHIIGCEMFYREALLAPLLDFLAAHLGPNGEALLSSDARREGRMFFDMAKDRFKLMKKDVPFTDSESGQDKIASLYRVGGQG